MGWAKRVIFSNTPLWALSILILVVIFLFFEAGFFIGKWRHQSRPEVETRMTSSVSSILALLAFMLTFTFSFSATLFKEKRLLVTEEANAIGTSYLRAGYLKEPHRTTIRNDLRDYVAVRLSVKSTKDLQEAIAQSEKIQDRLWAQATEVAEKNPESVVAGLFIQALNEVIDIHGKRLLIAVWTYIPAVIWETLCLLIALGMCMMGYQYGRTGNRDLFVSGALSIALTAVIILIADLDRPLEGTLRVSQQPMIELQKKLG